VNLLDFSGKTAVVTGGTRGIGKAAAQVFAELGARVVINGQNESLLEIVRDEIRALGAECESFRGDVSKFEVAASLIDFAIESFGSIDILVNSAGITRDSLVMRMSETDWDDVINVNLKGAFNTIRAAARPMMKQRSGAIVNVTSVVGLMGNAGQANYAASKGGVIALTKSVAKEFAPRGISCSAVAPGFIDTDMTKSLPPEIKEKYLDAIPLKKFGEARDVARAIAFLASAPYITGQILSVDGGLYM
jgi:3-oxoacyl-[acyl-carrier protein] reductase